jgi:ribose transport system substrate-binding protein
MLVGAAGVAREVTIAVACQSMTSSPTRITTAVTELCKPLGWKVITFDGNGDQQKVNDAALTWILSKQVDAIYILFPPEGSLGEVIAAAQKAQIALITTGYFAGKGQTFDVGMNDFVGSAGISSYLFDRLGRKGNIVVFHWDVVPVPRQRIAILRAMLSETPEIKVVEDHHAKLPGHIEDCRATMESFLLAHPKGTIDAVWGAWDELTLGAVQAIEAAGRTEIFGVGIDGNLWTFDYIRRGSPFAATIAPDWEQCAKIVLDELSTNILNGKNPSQQQFYIDIPLVTKDNCPPSGWYYSEWVQAGMPQVPGPHK